MNAVVDCPSEQGPLKTTECKLSCFYFRENYRHTLRPLISEEKNCVTEPTCKEELAMMKAAYRKLITGTQTKSVDVNGKSYTNHQASITCLKEEIYALECRCGQYALKTQSSSCSCGSMKDVCGCSSGCGSSEYGGGWSLNW